MKKILQLALPLWIALFCMACTPGDPAISTAAQTELPSFVFEETEEPPQTTIPSTAPEPEPVQMAQSVQEDAAILLDGMDITKDLSDGLYRTRTSLKPNQILTVTSTHPFSALYILWDAIPGPYTLTWEGGRIDCGGESFLHEYVRLPETVNGVTFEFAEYENLCLCDIQLYTAGEPPKEVQQWLPPCDTADILVFPTHADDDVLFFGAVMSYYAIEEQQSVQTAFLVDHWYEPERNHERLDGLWALGLRNYPIVGTARDYMADSLQKAEAFHRSDDIPGWQVTQIRRFRPQVILGHDLGGEYGHNQHKLNARCLTASVESASNPTQYPESAQRYGVWDTPKLYLHLYSENELIFDVNTPLANDPQGRTPFEIAQDAYQCHVSQQKYNFYVSQSEQQLDCRRFGLYRTRVGLDTSGDIMEHLDPSSGQ